MKVMERNWLGCLWLSGVLRVNVSFTKRLQWHGTKAELNQTVRTVNLNVLRHRQRVLMWAQNTSKGVRIVLDMCPFIQFAGGKKKCLLSAPLNKASRFK